MKVCDINPHIRYAEQNFVKVKPENVRVMDCRIFSIVSGEAKIEVENQVYNMGNGAFFYCCGGTKYSISSENGANLFSLNFDLTQKNSHILTPYITIKESDAAYDNDFQHDIVKDCSMLNSYLYIDDGSTFQYAVKSIVKEFSSKRIYFAEKSSAILKDLLVDLYRKKPEKSDNSSEAVKEVISYIKKNFGEKLSNKTLADLVGYHEYHLNRLFLRHTGTSMHKYILRLRIDEAKRLLLNTDMPLGTIAEEIGFGSKTHFASYFKQVVGLSPSEYRLKFKNSI